MFGYGQETEMWPNGSGGDAAAAAALGYRIRVCDTTRLSDHYHANIILLSENIIQFPWNMVEASKTQVRLALLPSWCWLVGWVIWGYLCRWGGERRQSSFVYLQMDSFSRSMIHRQLFHSFICAALRLVPKTPLPLTQLLFCSVPRPSSIIWRRRRRLSGNIIIASNGGIKWTISYSWHKLFMWTLNLDSIYQRRESAVVRNKMYSAKMVVLGGRMVTKTKAATRGEEETAFAIVISPMDPGIAATRRLIDR